MLQAFSLLNVYQAKTVSLIILKQPEGLRHLKNRLRLFYHRFYLVFASACRAETFFHLFQAIRLLPVHQANNYPNPAVPAINNTHLIAPTVYVQRK